GTQRTADFREAESALRNGSRRKNLGGRPVTCAEGGGGGNSGRYADRQDGPRRLRSYARTRQRPDSGDRPQEERERREPLTHHASRCRKYARIAVDISCESVSSRADASFIARMREIEGECAVSSSRCSSSPYPMTPTSALPIE